MSVRSSLCQLIIRKIIKIIATRCHILVTFLSDVKFYSRCLSVRPSLRWSLTRKYLKHRYIGPLHLASFVFLISIISLQRLFLEYVQLVMLVEISPTIGNAQYMHAKCAPLNNQPRIADFMPHYMNYKPIRLIQLGLG